MFLGKYFCNLDEEHHFLAPDGFRKYLSGSLYITQGFDNNLWVFSTDAFQGIYKNLGRMNIADPLARLLFRMILGAATEIGVTDQGYLEIPDALREYGLIENQVLLIGQGNYFEIWSPKLWNLQEQELKNTVSNIERFAAFEITTR